MRTLVDCPRRPNIGAIVEEPDGIIITVAASTLLHHGNGNARRGYKVWLSNFMTRLSDANGVAYRNGRPKRDVLYVYIVVGNKIRLRVNFAGVDSALGRIIMCGPIVRPVQPVPLKGFQGFRYTHKLF